jgi:hypothetical protein
LLKLHKYFFWADKKLHAVFFIEDKEDISEDMLIDFKDIDEDDVKVRFKKSESLGGKKLAATLEGPKKINLERNKDRITKEDLLFGGKKKNLVNINDDDDFPDLEGDPFKQKAKKVNGPKIVAKKPAPNTTAWGYNEETPTKIGGNNVMLANNKARP